MKKDRKKYILSSFYSFENDQAGTGDIEKMTGSSHKKAITKVQER